MCLPFPHKALSRSRKWLDQVNPSPPSSAGTGRSSPLPENPKSHKFGKLLDPLPRFPSWKRSEEGWRIFLRPRYARPRCSPAPRLAGGGEGGWDYPAELTFILENSAPPRERKSFLNRTPSTFIPRLLVNSSKNSITIFRHEYFPRPGQISSHGWKLDEWTETIFFDTISYFCWIKLSYLVTFRENEVIIYTHIPFFNILNHDFSWQSFQLLSSKEGKRKKKKEKLMQNSRKEGNCVEIAFCFGCLKEGRSNERVK